ncbi:MAG TPA: hypothetical protein VJZ06_01395 [Mobilitalea sp.]|nr:hypothetical protein [Mobilitalea sp.]
MGLFRKFTSKKRIIKDQEAMIKSASNVSAVNGTVSTMNRSTRINTKTERTTLIRDNCEQILENNRQIEEAKAEYQAVTSYLTDMQKIDMIPKDQREQLEDASRKIINLSKEREKFREKNTKITDAQYRLFERYELQLSRELETIGESEKYQGLIQQDIEHLEQEKQNLIEEEEEILYKQSFLKAIAITTCLIVILLFVVFAILSSSTGKNLILPSLLTIMMGIAITLYIFMESRRNIHEIKMVGLKKIREVMLMNKVKLKSVNNRNYLEYTYSKYMVDNYDQLKTCWEEYIKVKDETRRYQNNTELLEFYNNELIQELKSYGISDSEIWIYQPTALLNSKEMVEVRHRLNVRRQKLRERIDNNNKQKQEAVQVITTIVKEYPDCEEDAISILKQYQIQP